MLSRQALAGVIEPRIEEIFSLVHQVMRESGFEEVLSSGIVLTGGSCVMPGMVELGEDIFLKPVRRGIPKYTGALSDMVAQPRAATVMGLLEEARMARLRGFKVAQKNGSMKTPLARSRTGLWGTFEPCHDHGHLPLWLARVPAPVPGTMGRWTSTFRPAVHLQVLTDGFQLTNQLKIRRATCHRND
jgi:cell division ATPase FtsA